MYSVAFSSTARKEILSIPEPTLGRVETSIDDLSVQPRPSGCVKLKGSKNAWRVRVGDYRILYGINDDQKIVLIYRILHRREAYR